MLKYNDNLSLVIMCELTKKICSKLFEEDQNLLEKLMKKLEYHYNHDKSIASKVKYLILDIIDLKKSLYEVKEYEHLKDNVYDFKPSIRNNSMLPESKRRKSSINPSNVEYIHRTRFNSKAEELLVNKDTFVNSSVMDEIVKELGADIEFYQCFNLSNEEFDIIKTHSNQYISAGHDQDKEDIKTNFLSLLENVPCEKFIAVGHLIEYLFSQSIKDSEIIMQYLLKLLELKSIGIDDLKHG